MFQVNFSKIIGRIALNYPSVVAPYMHKIAKLCLSSIKSSFKDQNMILAYTYVVSYAAATSKYWVRCLLCQMSSSK